MKPQLTILLPLALFLTFCSSADKQTKSKHYGNKIAYDIPNAKLEGYIALPTPTEDDSLRPAVLIVHDWMGLGDFQMDKADELAKMGYVAFAADIYGQDIRPENAKEAAKLSSHYKSSRHELRERIRAAYDELLNTPGVDPNKIVVMGYCFGGTTALELARSGAKLAGTVSFHGNLSTPNTKDAKKIRAPILVLHGADDPLVPAKEVAAFKKEMKDAKVKLTFISYPGAVHSFTNPKAGSDNSKGAAYNAEADKKSWIEFKAFLDKMLK